MLARVGFIFLFSLFLLTNSANSSLTVGCSSLEFPSKTPCFLKDVAILPGIQISRDASPILNLSSPAECQQNCATKSRCKYFTFSQKKSDPTETECILKPGISFATSFIVTSESTTSNTDFTFTSGPQSCGQKCVDVLPASTELVAGCGASSPSSCGLMSSVAKDIRFDPACVGKDTLGCNQNNSKCCRDCTANKCCNDRLPKFILESGSDKGSEWKGFSSDDHCHSVCLNTPQCTHWSYVASPALAYLGGACYLKTYSPVNLPALEKISDTSVDAVSGSIDCNKNYGVVDPSSITTTPNPGFTGTPLAGTCFETGADIIGDTVFIKWGGRNYTTCQERCQTYPSCRYFTYSQHQYTCVLKFSQLNRIKGDETERYVLGPKYCPDDPLNSKIDDGCYKVGQDVDGNTLQELHYDITSAKGCQERCDGDGACQFFSYHGKNQRCYLKNTRGPLIQNPAVISGPKSSECTIPEFDEPFGYSVAADGEQPQQQQETRDLASDEAGVKQLDSAIESQPESDDNEHGSKQDLLRPATPLAEPKGEENQHDQPPKDQTEYQPMIEFKSSEPSNQDEQIPQAEQKVSKQIIEPANEVDIISPNETDYQSSSSSDSPDETDTSVEASRKVDLGTTFTLSSAVPTSEVTETQPVLSQESLIRILVEGNVPQGCALNNINYHESDIDVIESVKSTGECRDICLSRADCHYLTYNIDEQRCGIKWRGLEVEKFGVISMPRICHVSCDNSEACPTSPESPPTPAVIGLSLQNFGSPSSWLIKGSMIDFTRPREWMRISLLILTANTREDCFVSDLINLGSDHKSCWDRREDYLPLKMRVQLIGIADGHTFSGWNSQPWEGTAYQPGDLQFELMNEYIDLVEDGSPNSDHGIYMKHIFGQPAALSIPENLVTPINFQSGYFVGRFRLLSTPSMVAIRCMICITGSDNPVSEVCLKSIAVPPFSAETM